MIDHLVGRPSPSWKRNQVFLVILFWLWRIIIGDSRGPRLFYARKVNRALERFTPWQIIASTLTAVYALRNLDKILNLGAPEPLARLYSPSYYRATWITTGLDAGFATAMAVRPKWLRDICSVLFSAYYIIYANEADEKLRRFRAVPTVEMLRVTWEKTTNPYIRLFTPRAPVSLHRKILLTRPQGSPYTRPITVHLFFAPHQAHTDSSSKGSKAVSEALSMQEDLILDFPGGGFVAMTPEHHEERLRMWAVRTGRPVASADYGKAPEYPYPFAIDEVFDTYRVLVESKGKVIGMSGKSLNVIVSGDSAGAAITIGAMIKVLEHAHTVADPTSSYPKPSSLPPSPLPLPIAIVLNYAALDFNFTSWMTPANLRVLRIETEADEQRPRPQNHRTPSRSHVPSRRSSSFFYQSDEDEDENVYDSWASQLRGAKDHLAHISPLAVVGDDRARPRPSMRRKKSWADSLKFGSTSRSPMTTIDTRSSRSRKPTSALHSSKHKSSSQAQSGTGKSKSVAGKQLDGNGQDHDADADAENDDVDRFSHLREEDRPIQARVKWHYPPSRNASGSPIVANPDSGISSEAASPVASRLSVLYEKEQATLENEVAQADSEVQDQRRREGVAPIGTRLTMTSRTGYFQDRIISPSMMRAMAILYIGPHLNPDFATDYHISPILTPSELLAKFPPLLMQCGEKDPFVDDTIIFAGRVREAKRQRKHELADLLNKTTVASRSAQVEWEEELERLNGESEEDWVQMQIFSDWSHGYLQMPALMKEAVAAINDLADWINDAFNTLGSAAQSADTAATTDAAAGAKSGSTSANSSGESSSTVHTGAATGHDEHAGLWRFWSWTKHQHQQDIRVQFEDENGHKAPRESAAIHADHLQPDAYPTTATETETENDEGITFIPKTRRQSSDVSGTGNGTRRARFSSSNRDVARDIPVFGSPPLTEDLLAGKQSLPQSQPQTKTLSSREPSPDGTVAESYTSSTPRRSTIPISFRRESQGAASATRPSTFTPQSISPPASGKMAIGDTAEVGERKGRDRTRSPEAVKRRSATPGTGVGGKTGTPVPNSRQTITEAELMRRRRLLDSHIFESE